MPTCGPAVPLYWYSQAYYCRGQSSRGGFSLAGRQIVWDKRCAEKIFASSLSFQASGAWRNRVTSMFMHTAPMHAGLDPNHHPMLACCLRISEYHRPASL
ncbi:hypothetical protein AC578_5268 [Pseudocercospora eumusae]|uniref:Uncharacterized protein n=1 Tax=Pseudocercospora eumusae TaxID=321146 RepID=A0A139GYM9_9PEZI|nr:hypothetical protein AC578_5268 [Pseudocercospora eumusae]